jgi:phage shock protein E
MSKSFFVVLVAVMLLFLMFKARRGPALNPDAAPYRAVGYGEAKALIDDGSAIIIDVRTPGEYHGGHIEGAINIPNESIKESRPASLDDLDAPIIVYCRSGARSKQAAVKLLNLGYTTVYDFGGISSWTDDLVR